MVKLEDIYTDLKNNWANDLNEEDVVNARESDQITCADQIEKVLCVMDSVLEMLPKNEMIRKFRNALSDWDEHIMNDQPIIQKGKNKAVDPVNALIEISCLLIEKESVNKTLNDIALWAHYETAIVERRLFEIGPLEYPNEGSENVLVLMKQAYLAV